LSTSSPFASFFFFYWCGLDSNIRPLSPSFSSENFYFSLREATSSARQTQPLVNSDSSSK
jgi:hypothetical protein